MTEINAWTPESWRGFRAEQQPTWPDSKELDVVGDTLRDYPPLVFAGEARQLSERLAEVSRGDAFLLMAGDCAESFAAFNANQIRDKLKVILQMSVALTYGSGVPTVKLARIAGQFAKPRSADTETRDGQTLPSYRGDLVNDYAFDAEARIPDPQRLLHGYHQAAATLNLVRAFTKGGFADLRQVHAWNQAFVAASPEGQRYESLATEIDRALHFMEACGIDLEREAHLHQVDLYTAHEALILEYEAALTREDSFSGDMYDCSAHMVWIGERTRQLDGAHIEFFRGIHNPIGVKIGPTVTAADAIDLCTALNPHRIPGRLTLIGRFGADKVRESLAPIVAAVEASAHPVVWACDPMHGNTFSHSSGYKTRRFGDVMNEIHGFFETCRAAGAWPGGVHVELTGEDVTECLGGSQEVSGDMLEQRYESVCDPRLNAQQSLDLAFEVAELLRA